MNNDHQSAEDESGLNSSIDAVADKQRAIQSRQDQNDAKQQQEEGKQAIQTSDIEQPGTPLPQQHLVKPGLEASMELRPRFMAEAYKGSGKLQGMTAIVTG